MGRRAVRRPRLPHSPIDVVAWHGNYAPYKYDLRTFSPVGAIGFDHPDPSIFTVLTSPSETAGTANIDFVIFPERWAVAENTFRPPWYHMNIMSEFMGLIYGVYDAKPQGFVPGGISLHNCMLPHGPDREAFDHASNSELKPVKLTGTMAFMFETRYPQRVTEHAAKSATCRTITPIAGRDWKSGSIRTSREVSVSVIYSFVMPGLVPGIHVLLLKLKSRIGRDEPHKARNDDRLFWRIDVPHPNDPNAPLLHRR